MLKRMIKAIKNPKIIMLYILEFKIFRIIPDDIYIGIKYRLCIGKRLNLNNPKTFNEKLQWLKLYDRKNEYTQFVDKYEVRKYIKKIIGKEYLIPLLGVYNSFDEIDFNELPEQFVLKPTHTSGNIYICKDKSRIDYVKLKKEVNMWLNIEYFWLHREWPYKNVKPRVICEKYMVDESGNDLKDYKFMCFNGKSKIIQLHTDRFGNHRQYLYDIWGNLLEFNNIGYSNDNSLQLDTNITNKMIELAELLSKNIPQLRVDFYYANDKIYFGELTFFDSAGFTDFTPDKYNLILGNMIDLHN